MPSKIMPTPAKYIDYLSEKYQSEEPLNIREELYFLENAFGNRIGPGSGKMQELRRAVSFHSWQIQLS